MRCCRAHEERTNARAEQFGLRYYIDVTRCSLPKSRLGQSQLAQHGTLRADAAVIRAGYPLLVEKPLVFNLTEAETLLREAEARDLFFAINFNHRYAKPVQLAKAAIDEADWVPSSSRPGASAAKVVANTLMPI